MTHSTLPLQTESIYLPVGADILHMKRLYVNPKGTLVFMLHGSMSSGSIFYSQSMKGLAPFLAQQGFDVYVLDLRGRGQSKPHVSKLSTNTLNQALTEEIPAAIAKIKAMRGEQTAIHAAAHSWGGVMLIAYLLRFPNAQFASLTCLGTKRVISWANIRRFLPVDLYWLIIGRLLTLIYGYLPAKKLKMGSDDESTALYIGSRSWVYRHHQWLDDEDGFDYQHALTTAKNLPPTLYIAAQNDAYLGNPKDVLRFKDEVHHEGDVYQLLSKQNGNALDYDHINMCTAPEAVTDHFPVIAAWMLSHSQD